MKKNQHVTPHSSGGWQVKGEKNKKATVVRKTKAEAIAEGKRLAKGQNAELIIHNLDGKISEKNTYGKDNFPPRG